MGEFRAALKELGQFSHVLVFWWADGVDDKENRSRLLAELPYAKGVKAGVFACRSESRPNPILMSVCEILDVNEKEGTIKVDYIEAFDGSKLIDLKPFIPMGDRPKEVKTAEWFKDWPVWREEAGAFFQEHSAELFGINN